jgi:hypothetical protein
MNRRFWVGIVAALGAAPAWGDPVMLSCTDEHPSALGRSYQVVFDEARQTVQLDNDSRVRAKITATMITWETAQGWVWKIDRLTGLFSAYPHTGGPPYPQGNCSAPPARKF